MRIFVTILLVITTCSCGTEKQSHDFKIIIEEFAMLGISVTTLTQDSLVITTRGFDFKDNISTDKKTQFKKRLTNDERNDFITSISRINLKTMRDSYYGEHLSSDNYEFTFTFDINGVTKKTTIYEYKHKEMFDLVSKINKLTPESFRIMYNEWYLTTFDANAHKKY